MANLHNLLNEDALKAWINPQYLHEQVIPSISMAFKDGPFHSVQLRQFLAAGPLNMLRADVMQAGLTPVSVPDEHEYSQINSRMVMGQFANFMRSKHFLEFLSAIVEKKVSCTSVEWLSFGHQNYTLLQDKLRQKQAVYAMLDFASLDQGCGGFTSVMYSNEELGRIIPIENSLTVFRLPKDARYFTKYVNNTAGQRRRMVMVAVME